MTEYHITPVPKPRMTQRDKWQKRQAVLRYRAFKDDCRFNDVSLPLSGAHIVFNMPMPKSWSKKKCNEMNGLPHQNKPDCDNLLKSLMDAVYDDDSSVYDVRISKFWSEKGSVIIK
ncbi:MAG: RusA family crossover junction endodeoxyribonuclease [Gammaproteobacteria bacterium]|nr:RusA family crossover junction endodeoxyribonuclease [Gammaproteobacteria bacterium]